MTVTLDAMAASAVPPPRFSDTWSPLPPQASTPPTMPLDDAPWPRPGFASAHTSVHTLTPPSSGSPFREGSLTPSTVPDSRFSSPAADKPLPAHFAPVNEPLFGRPPGLPVPNHLDRHAPVYIPSWLLRVNNEVPMQIRVSDQSSKQNLVAWAEAVYPKTLLDRIVSVEAAHEVAVQKALSQSKAGLTKLPYAISESNGYAKALLKLQFEEHAARKADLAKATLYDVIIRKLTGPDMPPHLYKLEAPSIREGYPPCEPGDAVHLRQLRPQAQSWQGIEFVASVYATRRRLGFVILQCEALEGQMTTMHFNVSFRPQDRPFFAQHKGLVYLDRLMPFIPLANSLAEGKSLASHWLFPKADPPVPESERSTNAPKKLEYYDTNLNEQQQYAVRSIVFHRRRVPFLISGPPGTGKTKTLVETILQIVKAYPDAHLLVCGASNPSSDTVAMRLSQRLSPKEMLRLNDESRPLEESKSELLPWCSMKEDKFTLPPMEKLLKYRVIVTSVLDASLLQAARFTNTALACLEYATIGVLRPEVYAPTSFHFDWLLVDEAAQASEPEIAPALAVVLPDTSLLMSRPEHKSRRLPQLVLCGDHMQLGPQISSETARYHDLDLSLLQRLFERDLYRNHPKARHNLLPAMKERLLRPIVTPASYLPDDEGESLEPDTGEAQSEANGEVSGVSNGDDALLETKRPEEAEESDLSTPFANLTRNYRSHPGLLMLPSALFYNNTLEPAAAPSIQNTPLLKWKRLNKAEVPLLVWHTEGFEEMFEEGSSWFNELEIVRVIQLCQELTNGSARKGIQVQPSEISIISPFREQVWRIRLRLRKMDLGAINVGRETDMQGAENRVIIISTVRTSPRFVPDDKIRNRGLVYEPKRFNVSITRAKELLLVVGDARLLSVDPYWRAFIRFAMRRKAFDGPSLESLGMQEDPTVGVSLLEEEFANSANHDGDDSLIASSVARMALGLE